MWAFSDAGTLLQAITVCEITSVVQGDTLSEGYKICMEMCRFVRTMCLNYVRISIVSQQPLLKFIRTSFLYNFKIACM